jgi:Holliday junction resolvase RusA-like endonuclease
MIYSGILDLSRPSISIDFDLIKSIIHRVIKTTIGDVLNTRQFDVSHLLWYPSWKWDRDNHKKTLKDIYVKLQHQKDYQKLDSASLKSTGLQLYEFFEYLEKSDAIRARITP